jgi:pentachlorophenol monooxygenase/3-(3-hydroxy-phenyl)propionate hydroxylase
VRGGRIRALARDGFLLLAAPGVDPTAVTGHDARTLELADIDNTGALGSALDARPGELWVVRPDAHVAAVLDRPGVAEVRAALRRALGYAEVGEARRDGVLPAVG